MVAPPIGRVTAVVPATAAVPANLPRRRASHNRLPSTQREVLAVVAWFGVVPLGFLTLILRALDETPLDMSRYYRRLYPLVKRGLLTTMTSRACGLPRAPGSQRFIAPGPAWADRAKSWGLPVSCALPSDIRTRDLAERAVLSVELVRRACGGWQFLRGQDWLAAAGRGAGERTGSGRSAMRVARELESGTLRFPPGEAPLGLIPPAATDALPALVAGGQWSQMRNSLRIIRAAAPLAPFEVIAHARSGVVRMALLREGKRHRVGGAELRVTVVPRELGVAWTRYWEGGLVALRTVDGTTIRWLGQAPE